MEERFGGLDTMSYRRCWLGLGERGWGGVLHRVLCSIAYGTHVFGGTRRRYTP